MKTLLSRRALLRRTGAAALFTVPFLSSLEAFAQGAPKKRLLIFTTPNGTVMDQFWPGAGVTTYKSILAPLQPLQAKINVLRGIDNKAGIEATSAGLPGHVPHFPSLLTGAAPRAGSGYAKALMDGPSIDQHIATGLGAVTRIKSKELAVGSYSGGYNLLARAALEPLSPELSPYNAFNHLFSMTPGGTTPDPTLQRLAATRKSVFDSVRGELSQLRCALGASDRVTFDAHLTSIREIERELEYVPPAASTCTPPTLGAAMPTGQMSNFPKMTQLQIDLAAAAFACDVTRVITLQFHTGASSAVHAWADGSINGTHHGIGHNSEGVNASNDTRRAWLLNIENWFAKQFFYLVNKLNSIPDGPGKTLLDNTVVVWGHEQTEGNSHQITDMPWVLAGSCGGYFKTGQNIQYSGKTNNDLMITLAQAMGLPTTTFGAAKYVTGPLAGLKA